MSESFAKDESHWRRGGAESFSDNFGGKGRPEEARDEAICGRRAGAKGDDEVKRFEVRGWFEETGIIAAVRVKSTEDALFAAEAVARGGVVVIEIPLSGAPTRHKSSTNWRKPSPALLWGREE